MPKERSINPAQAERKKEKAKAIKKGKAEAQTRRTEKLARRNPDRLQSQLDELAALESSGGKLTATEVKMKEELERDVKAVRKAREALGDKAPNARREGGGYRDGAGMGERGSGRGGGVLGKRRRGGSDGGSGSESGSEVPEDVRAIPMPRDTPPPIPKDVLDKWYAKRRERHAASRGGGLQRLEQQDRRGVGTSANNLPLGANARFAARREGEEGGGDGDGRGEDVGAKARPVVEAKTVYEAAPAIRDLRKEAVSAFVPAAVRLKMEKARGKGGLVEPEEADRLEREGYMGVAAAGGGGGEGRNRVRAVEMEEVEDEDDY